MLILNNVHIYLTFKKEMEKRVLKSGVEQLKFYFGARRVQPQITKVGRFKLIPKSSKRGGPKLPVEGPINRSVVLCKSKAQQAHIKDVIIDICV